MLKKKKETKTIYYSSYLDNIILYYIVYGNQYNNNDNNINYSNDDKNAYNRRKNKHVNITNRFRIAQKRTNTNLLRFFLFSPINTEFSLEMFELERGIHKLF